MNSQWQQFLTSTQTTESDTTSSDTMLCDLSQIAIICVSGEDAISFLQGQLTNDIKEINNNQYQLSGYCTPKGRLLAIFRIFKHEDKIILLLPQEISESIFKRLKMYVMRSKVSLELIEDQYHLLGLYGSQVQSLLKHQQLDFKVADTTITYHTPYTILSLPGEQTRAIVLSETKNIISLWQLLAPQCQIKNTDFWRQLDISSGQPNIYSRTSEAFVPQMTNLGFINAINFTKGCYTGQEIVARMQYLGKLKRKMYLANIKTNQPVQPGDSLSSKNSQSQQGVGKIVDAIRTDESGYDVLAVIEIASQETGEVTIQDGTVLNFKSLPYDTAIDSNSRESRGQPT